VKGSNDVIVAVVDSGVLVNHPDLSGRLAGGYNFVRDGNRSIGPDPNDPGNSDPGTSTSSFHGTHVAGIIAAETDNFIGIAGVTWSTRIMPLRVLSGGTGSIFDVREGIRYAAGLPNASGTVPAKPADIINLSLGTYSSSTIDRDLFRQVRERNIIVIASAGNDNTSMPSFPASYEGVISVSAVSRNGTKASYSNHGHY
jgi:serine protease